MLQVALARCQHAVKRRTGPTYKSL
jgi:hypothetical protein